MRGKGGSMHITSVEHHMLGSYAIVGAHLPTALGAAWSARPTAEIRAVAALLVQHGYALQ